MIAMLRERHPGIAVAFDVDDRSLSLSRREADIAIRLAKFMQNDAIVRKVAAMKFGLFASDADLAQRRMPDLALGAPGHAVITLREDLLNLPEAKWLSQRTRAAGVALASSSRQIQLAAARSGLGLACLLRYLADGEPGLTMLEADDPPSREIWIGVHRDARRVPRIRAVIDHLSSGLSRAMALLDPA